MEKRKIREVNRNYLSKVFMVKSYFYPFINIMTRVDNYKALERFINFFIRISGVRKSVHFFFKYRDYGKWFSGRFKSRKGETGLLLFPVMTGVNSNFTLLNLLLGDYFSKRDGLKPVLYICDSAVEICTKDGTLKSREKFPYFCEECWKGYEHLEDITGIDIIRMSEMIEVKRDDLIGEELAIDKIKNLDGCAGYSFNGIKIGLLARKSVLRYFLTGKLEDSDKVVFIYKRFLKAGLRYSMAFEEVLRENPAIKYIFFNNGSLVFEAIGREYCHRMGLQYMTYETYLGNNSIIYKKNGAVMDFDWEEEYIKYKSNFVLDDYSKQKVSGFFGDLRNGVEMYAVLNREHNISKMKGLDRYACLFTNLNYDTAVIDKNHLFSNMESWIFSVIEFWQRENPPVSLVIRVHPGELKLVTASREFLGDRIKRVAGDNKNIIVFDSDEDINSYELIKGMEFGLIYSSTIGLEIAWEGKICMVAGLPWFRNRSFVHFPLTMDDYFLKLHQLNNGEFKFIPGKEELYKTVNFIYFDRVNRFNEIKFYTPREEPNTLLDNPEEMISRNKYFFERFRDELYS